ncbi:MAG TPA: valine--tRNA ligase, partial [Candidatus Peregrinibacteria bacterium]|nr:valine--tRNA ligase [Candidatus Peregrinibacteria bacterium]
MELEKAYQAKKYEDDIYKLWEDSGVFTPKIDQKKKPFVISMPPPNATGQLHLGHAVMLAIEDILVRYHRMLGESALWLPGTDHAAIATQNKVERILEEEGKNRHELGREKFLERVKEFVKGSQSTIRNQIRKMGTSCDWTRERYTMDEMLTRTVHTVFKKMYEDGLIYRGDRIINWCPRCSSTLADDEVDHKEQEGQFYYIKYGPFSVATTRPETKLGDTAVAVHPKDERYKKYIGKEFDIDLAGHKIHIKVIADRGVDPELGTGAIGVTPAHSM